MWPSSTALVAPLWRYWFMRGRLLEGRELTEAQLDEALDVLSMTRPPAA